MADDPAAIVHRRRLKRHLNIWRIAAVMAVIAAALTLASRF